MKKINISSEEVELMNYNDIAYLILEENGKKMKISTLFSEVGNILGMAEEEYQSYIGDFFELISTDKRFIMLEEGYWDLKIKHNKGMESFDDDEDDDEEIILEDENVDGEDIFDENSVQSEDDDVDDDDLSDLVIVDDLEDDSNL